MVDQAIKHKLERGATNATFKCLDYTLTQSKGVKPTPTDTHTQSLTPSLCKRIAFNVSHLVHWLLYTFRIQSGHMGIDINKY